LLEQMARLSHHSATLDAGPVLQQGIAA